VLSAADVRLGGPGGQVEQVVKAAHAGRLLRALVSAQPLSAC